MLFLLKYYLAEKHESYRLITAFLILLYLYFNEMVDILIFVH